MTDLKNIKKKTIRLIGKFSDTSRDGVTSSQTEIETPEGVVTVSEYVTFDCRCHFDSSKIVIYERKGEKFCVCENCCVECWSCKQKVWAKYATRIGDVWLCPDHVLSGIVKLAMEAVSKRKGD
ncbi:MAG: hypothetical protein MUP55_04840 [Candidatus Aenigmarchaeota archaeon]|nr:hypothetical protein [Candidatus Aenigmarchaeota archaeon]